MCGQHNTRTRHRKLGTFGRGGVTHVAMWAILATALTSCVTEPDVLDFPDATEVRQTLTGGSSRAWEVVSITADSSGRTGLMGPREDIVVFTADGIGVAFTEPSDGDVRKGPIGDVFNYVLLGLNDGFRMLSAGHDADEADIRRLVFKDCTSDGIDVEDHSVSGQVRRLKLAPVLRKRQDNIPVSLAGREVKLWHATNIAVIRGEDVDVTDCTQDDVLLMASSGRGWYSRGGCDCLPNSARNGGSFDFQLDGRTGRMMLVARAPGNPAPPADTMRIVNLSDHELVVESTDPFNKVTTIRTFEAMR